MTEGLKITWILDKRYQTRHFDLYSSAVKRSLQVQISLGGGSTGQVQSSLVAVNSDSVQLRDYYARNRSPQSPSVRSLILGRVCRQGAAKTRIYASLLLVDRADHKEHEPGKNEQFASTFVHGLAFLGDIQNPQLGMK
jgi:hypothetical protein